MLFFYEKKKLTKSEILSLIFNSEKNVSLNYNLLHDLAPECFWSFFIDFGTLIPNPFLRKTGLKGQQQCLFGYI